jgi:CubicO group peptidase (beta-lactamase class C family)
MGIAVRVGLLALLVAGGLGARWLWVATQVGAGFAAKVTCSLVFVSGQGVQRVLDDYVAYELAPAGALFNAEVSGREVVATALGVPRARAAFRPGLGCTQLHGGAGAASLPGAEVAPPSRAPLDPSVPWPLGSAALPEPAPGPIEAAIDRAFAEPDPEGEYRRQTTAVVVARDGRLVAERYAPGYGPATPMLSWSMAKSVTAALVGLAAEEGRLALHAPAPVREWSDAEDPRRAITLDHLMRMSSGLRFDERYRATTDASVMLFTGPDTGEFAARKPLDAPPDAVWSYSSGTSNLVSRMLRDVFGGDLGAMLRWARERLFDPAGLTSAFLEPDASGTFIGSSFAFMTARDWARFGELHRRDGEWFGRRILREGWVRYVTTPTPAAPRGGYGAHWWLNAGAPDDPADRPWPELPADTYAARGHSGQYVVVVPSSRLVVVRLGLSVPDQGDDGADALVAELIRHFESGPR